MIYYKDSTTDSLTLQRLALHVALVQKSHHDDFQLPHDQIETSLNGPLRLFFFNHASNLVTKLEFSVLKTVFLITEVSPLDTLKLFAGTFFRLVTMNPEIQMICWSRFDDPVNICLGCCRVFLQKISKSFSWLLKVILQEEVDYVFFLLLTSIQKNKTLIHLSMRIRITSRNETW